MNEGPTDRVERWLLGWSRSVRRHARLIMLVTPFVTGLLGWHAARTLRVNTDTSSMVSDDLEYRRIQAAYEAAFPGNEQEIVVVLTGETPWLAEDAARRLAGALRADTAVFAEVHSPGVGEYWDRHGLMYLAPDSLSALADRLESSAPLLLDLEADPTLDGLATALQRALRDSAGSDSADANALAPILGLFTATTYAASEGRQAHVPWSAIVQGRMPSLQDRRRTLTVRPRLEFENQVPGRLAISRIREAARGLRLVERNGVRIRLTGKVAIESEEIVDAIDGVATSGFLALALVSLILYLALRSARLIAAALVTLGVGLVTTAFAAAVLVGQLNLISVAFTVLYIGLGIDYAIHLILRYTSRLRAGHDQAAAVDSAVSQVGPSLGISALTTAGCFYAFVPTDFTGVSELGVIGGTGMFVSFVATVTILPAFLSVFPVRGGSPVPAGGLPVIGKLIHRWRRPILVLVGGMTLFAMAGLPRARFDHNPLNLRDPASESVVAYRELLADPLAKPLSLSALRLDRPSVEQVRTDVSVLAEAEGTRSVFDFVPSDQEAKLPVLGRITSALTADGRLPPAGEGASADTSWSTPVNRLADVLTAGRWMGSSEVSDMARQLHFVLRAWERRVGEWPEQERSRQVAALERALLGGLTGRIAQLRQAELAGPVAVGDLPAELRHRWIGANGRYRVEIVPAVVLIDNEPLREFVDGVREVVPDATGSAVGELETGRVAVGAFRAALGTAGLVTVVLLLLLQRNLRVVVYVAGPLLVAGLWTAGLTGWLGMPFNFANVIALPLLLGVGVDNGIHMVHQARVGRHDRRDPMNASTSRAVLFATLTTMASFGNLAFAVHVGMASMGSLLSLGMTCVLVATLVFLPALMAETTKAAEIE
ncbi:MAG: MMPL family transporter [Gemmatimonadota bacterium]|nr:MMPL family transporter [Gemmatimonadota bacterium]